MMQGALEIEWRKLDEAIPGFLCLAAMPFTFSIANGLALGIASWVAIRVLSGRARDVSLPQWILAASLSAYLFVLDPGRSRSDIVPVTPPFRIDPATKHASAQPREAAFYRDPYAFYDALHAQAPTFFWENYGHWCFAGSRT